MVGESRAKLVHVAPTPTHNGVMALTRSSFVSKASALVAHWMVFAAILPRWFVFGWLTNRMGMLL